MYTYIVKMCSFRALTLSLTHYFMLHIFRSLSQTHIRLCFYFFLSLTEWHIHYFWISSFSALFLPFSRIVHFSFSRIHPNPNNYIHFIRLKLISFLHFASSIIVHARILCKSLLVKLKMSVSVCMCVFVWVWVCVKLLTCLD